MEKLIVSQNKHWVEPYRDIYDRSIVKDIIKRLELRQIEVLQGIRRSGKSTILKLLINHISKQVDPKEILYLNLDDPFFIPYTDNATMFYNVIETASKITDRKIRYLFLDEVQAINGWERFVKSAYDSEDFTKIFVTGSNGTFLSKDLAKLLSGRYFSTNVHPLSFAEILQINDINDQIEVSRNSPKVLSLVDDTLRYGSFVEIYKSPKEFSRDIIKSYYETVILKDCIYNGAIRDTKSFKELSFYLLNNITATYSYNSIAKAIGITDISAKEYLSLLEDSFLVYEVKQFSYSLKEQNRSKKKIYIVDNGFLLLSYRFSQNLGALFENMIFGELLKKDYEVFFYNKNFECDFIAKKDNKLIAIQACYELNEKNHKRDFGGLQKLPFEVDAKLIITYNQSQTADDIKVVRFYEMGREI